jgi:hypothetical protein
MPRDAAASQARRFDASDASVAVSISFALPLLAAAATSSPPISKRPAFFAIPIMLTALFIRRLRSHRFNLPFQLRHYIL